jgi:hypothetical protein
MSIAYAEAPVWSIGGLIVNQLDSVGGQWMPGLSSGWYDGAGVRLNQVPVPRAHGAYRANSYFNPRTIVVTGNYLNLNGNVAATQAARDLVKGVFANGTQTVLTVTDKGQTRTSTVEPGDQPKITMANPTAFDFQLTLSAADPRLYGPAQSSTTGPASSTGGLDWATGGGLDWATGGGLNWGTTTSNGTVTVSNPGNTDTWPVFTLAANGGTLVNPVLTDQTSGNQLAFNLTLSGTDQVVITTLQLIRTVLYNGTDYRAAMTSTQWFPVLAGQSDTVQFTESSYTGSPTVTMTASPAYW